MVARKAPKKPARQGPGAYLFVDDDDRVVRFRIGADRVHIGRDQSNDIWIDHDNAADHCLVIFPRDDHDAMKVYDGANVDLNGVPVTKLHRLYGGDRIQVANREFLYARDDMLAESALALTIAFDREIMRSVVLRQTRVRIGRRDADVVLSDASVSDRHALIEAYATDGIFISDRGSSMGTQVDGHRIEGRARLRDGSEVQIGRLTLFVHVLPPEAHGLLVLPKAKRDRPRQVHTPIRARNYDIRMDKAPAATTPATKADRPRPPRAGPAPAALASAPTDEVPIDLNSDEILIDPEVPPPTVLASLSDIQRSEKPEEAAPRRSRKRPRPKANRSDSWKPTEQPAPKRPAPPPLPEKAERKRRPPRARPEQQPLVRVAPEVYERGRQHVDAPPGTRHKEQRRRYGAGRSGAHGDDMRPPAPAPRSRKGMHDKLTDVLDTNNVRDLAGDRYVAAYQNVEPSHPERDKRYRPSRPGGARVLSDQKLVPREGGAPPRDPFGLHAQPTRAGAPGSGGDVKLTNVLDLQSEAPRLSRDRHSLDPEAMPQQLREVEDVERSRGAGGRIDASRRRNRKRPIDSSRRLDPDEE